MTCSGSGRRRDGRDWRGCVHHPVRRRQTAADRRWSRSRTAAARRGGPGSSSPLTSNPSSSTQAVTGGPSPRRLIQPGAQRIVARGLPLRGGRIHRRAVGDDQRRVRQHRHVDLCHGCAGAGRRVRSFRSIPLAGVRSATSSSGSAEGGAALPRPTTSVSARPGRPSGPACHATAESPSAVARISVRSPDWERDTTVPKEAPGCGRSVVRERWTMRRTVSASGRRRSSCSVTSTVVSVVSSVRDAKPTVWPPMLSV